ncbi:MAG: ChbG/HpnK family deacetylase [Candidatus Methylomirabilales bacterium]
MDQAVGDVAPDAFWQADRLVRFLRGLPPGLTELMRHPGYADDALSVSSDCAQREVGLHALCDPRVKDALRAAGVRCIAYGDLAADQASRR